MATTAPTQLTHSLHRHLPASRPLQLTTPPQHLPCTPLFPCSPRPQLCQEPRQRRGSRRRCPSAGNARGAVLAWGALGRRLPHAFDISRACCRFSGAPALRRFNLSFVRRNPRTSRLLTPQRHPVRKSRETRTRCARWRRHRQWGTTMRWPRRWRRWTRRATNLLTTAQWQAPPQVQRCAGLQERGMQSSMGALRLRCAVGTRSRAFCCAQTRVARTMAASFSFVRAQSETTNETSTRVARTLFGSQTSLHAAYARVLPQPPPVHPLVNPNHDTRFSRPALCLYPSLHVSILGELD
mmetsp:Transcript_26453/g.45540  ORF Transcript_26453/g.45540 Transcript_26453/m.45540 type:complete len:296 (-) Transcript_26453:27-914(-)